MSTPHWVQWINNAGTSEGVRKGWDTRRSGVASVTPTPAEVNALAQFKAVGNAWTKGQSVPELDSAITRHKTPETMSITRFSNLPEGTPMPTHGTILQPNGYFTGSSDPNWKWPGNTKTHVFMDQGVSAYEYPYDPEREVVLPHNAKLEVMGTHKGADGVNHIFAKYVA